VHKAICGEKQQLEIDVNVITKEYENLTKEVTTMELQFEKKGKEYRQKL
jgi:hypothetical protein